MQYYNEKVQYENPLLSMRIFRAERTDSATIQWHYHKELEILAIQQGSLEASVQDESYMLGEGDVCIFGSSELHRDRSLGGHLEYIVLQFDLQAYFDQSTRAYIRHFGETKHPLSKLNYIFHENSEARSQVNHIVQEILRETQQKDAGYEIAVSMLIKQIILILLRGDSRKLLMYRSDPELDRLQPVLEYIEDHLQERMNVESACKLVNMSYYYFVKFFKQVMGMNFTDYINMKRIKAAERLLLTKDISIVEAAEQVGMPNMAHFYKFFKKYNNSSPNEFRKKMLRA